MNTSRTCRFAATVLLAAVATAAPAAAETIVLRSGQVGAFPGLPGQFDSNVTFGNTVPTGPLSASPFVAADFNAAASNPSLCITPHSAWIPGLTFDPQARWIGTDFYPGTTLGASASTLHRIAFTVTTVGITSASISMAWSADDGLGDIVWGGANPIGAYLRDSFGNVTALTPAAGGNFTIESSIINYNILGAITTGVNELFFYQRDQGGAPSGLIFGAELHIVPTPGVAAMLGLGGLATLRRRR
ncbi:MAG: hypothetical protein Q8L55_05170 [Phycisphaerales bacterium]|nr:hypothetical protein [Phycisphaerales bacterium]